MNNGRVDVIFSSVSPSHRRTRSRANERELSSPGSCVSIQTVRCIIIFHSSLPQMNIVFRSSVWVRCFLQWQRVEFISVDIHFCCACSFVSNAIATYRNWMGRMGKCTTVDSNESDNNSNIYNNNDWYRQQQQRRHRWERYSVRKARCERKKRGRAPLKGILKL